MAVEQRKTSQGWPRDRPDSAPSVLGTLPRRIFVALGTNLLALSPFSGLEALSDRYFERFSDVLASKTLKKCDTYACFV